jgi:hypothetical protein
MMRGTPEHTGEGSRDNRQSLGQDEREALKKVARKAELGGSPGWSTEPYVSGRTRSAGLAEKMISSVDAGAMARGTRIPSVDRSWSSP